MAVDQNCREIISEGHKFQLQSSCPLLFFILLIGCHRGQPAPGPTIEFTRVPPVAEGGPDKLDVIQGRVRGAQPGQQIVLYVNTGKWVVQPLDSAPFTRLDAENRFGFRPGEEATWVNSTHVGTEYAALLVAPGYHPPAVMDSLPVLGGGVVAVARAKGAGDVSKTIFFSGYESKKLSPRNAT
jgi:hypothetical protein